MTLYLLCAATAGLGLAMMLRLAAAPAPRLGSDVATWHTQRAAATARTSHPSTSGPQAWVTSFADTLAHRWPDHARGLDQDLAATGDTREAWLLRTATMGLAPLGILVLLTPLGALLGWPTILVQAGPLLATGVAVALVCAARIDLAKAAARRREEFRRGLSLYLDLVVMSMEAGRGHAEALPTVAGIGTGWVFDELRAAIHGARTHGVTAWTALGRVGSRLGISELIDLEAAISLAQDEGGRVRDSLVSRAHSMRTTRAANLKARAATRTDAMRNTLVLMALLTAGYVIIARLLYLLTA